MGRVWDSRVVAMETTRVSISKRSATTPTPGDATLATFSDIFSKKSQKSQRLNGIFKCFQWIQIFQKTSTHVKESDCRIQPLGSQFLNLYNRLELGHLSLIWKNWGLCEQEVTVTFSPLHPGKFVAQSLHMEKDPSRGLLAQDSS